MMDQTEQQIVFRSVSDLVLLKSNPRKITKADFGRLCDSIRINGFWIHRPIALSDRTGELVILAGNQRLKASKKLKLEQVPTILYHNPTTDEEMEIIFRDNVNNGEWDNKKMNDPLFEDVDFNFMGISLDDPEDKHKKKKNTESMDVEDDNEDKDDSDEDTDSENDEKEAFYRSMWKDVLYDSNNEFDIPNLLLDNQAGHLELPLSPWGANSRLRKDVSTYHFYVDDYRFEALFKDPIKLVTSGCKAIVEPNCSLHDQTPIAWGLQLLYKKRFLSRYLQECGIKVYVDLNVSHKFIEYNKMGIPKGYNAFFTRGLDGWMESLNSDFKTAQEISGLESPNLCVYGGGEEIQEFCRQHSLLYVTDFINAKK
jgi:hypothetical protein